jgi:hypothetical protein
MKAAPPMEGPRLVIVRSLLVTAALAAAAHSPGPTTPAARAGAPVETAVVTGAVREQPPAEAPSSCRPANNRGTITPSPPSAGHRHYKVTLTAAPGYAPCSLAGAPTDVVFHSAGDAPLGVRTTPSPDRGTPVTFGPGHPIHFDIQVPNSPGGARATRIGFTVRAPGGVIPGDQNAAGPLEVDAGTQIGPVQPGA